MFPFSEKQLAIILQPNYKFIISHLIIINSTTNMMMIMATTSTTPMTAATAFGTALVSR